MNKKSGEEESSYHIFINRFRKPARRGTTNITSTITATNNKKKKNMYTKTTCVYATRRMNDNVDYWATYKSTKSTHSYNNITRPQLFHLNALIFLFNEFLYRTQAIK